MALELAFAIADTRTLFVFVFDLHRRCVYQEIAPEVVRCRGGLISSTAKLQRLRSFGC